MSEVIDFQHKFGRSIELLSRKLPMCDAPVGYIVLRGNDVEIICAFGHVARWKRFETNAIAWKVAVSWADVYHVSMRDESGDAA